MFAIPYLCGLNPRYMMGSHRYPYSDEEAGVMRDKALEARQIADEFGVLIHTHGFKGVFEWAEEHYGSGVLREVLGPDVILAHMNGLTDHDIGIMRETDCAASAVPFAAGNPRYGTCPIVKLIQNQVRVAISTDGAAPFHISDLFIDLHRAMFLQWMENHDMSLLPSGRAVRLVTVEAAALLGMAGEIGSLEVGKKADIILVDLDQPHLVPFEDVANMIAWYVRGNDVDTVIVDGVILMEGRRMFAVDEGEVLAYARQEIKKSFERIDVSEYLEHSFDFWQGWREVDR
jgi:5-methylthioadenosine/S-adenosylhomocysteine deaminase